jgi:predicted DsbA family dithiol-disulfide isomerase
MSQPYRIEVVSDFVCPWCFIGTHRLEQALAGKEARTAIVSYRPFLLDPRIPPEGVDLRDTLRKKFGGDPEPMFGRVEAAARDAGIALDFSKVRRYPSTVRAHALVRRAKDPRALANALFEAYFLQGRDIGSTEVLAELAGSADLEESELQRVRDEAREASAEGITGVPFFVFGDKIAVSGAQPPEVFQKALSMST